MKRPKWALGLALIAATATGAPDRQLVLPSTPDIVATASKGTVSIEVRRLNGQAVVGSGFIIDASGTIVTSLHVVQNAAQINVRLPTDEIYVVTGVRAVDARRDVAVLQVAAFGLPVVSLGDSNQVRTGERVIAIGNALGLLDNSVTTGVLSGIRDAEGTRLFQIDAAVSPGNSGGPIVNEAGQAIGVVRGKLTAGESLNFAVPINYVRGLLQLEPSKGLTLLATSVAEDAPTETTSMGAEAPGGFPAYWRSLVSGKVRTARVVDDFVYIEDDIPGNLRAVGAMSLAELHKQGDTWVGTHRIRISCKTFILPRKLCPTIELPMTITVLSSSRIEGIGEYPPDNIEFSCSRCEYQQRVEPKPFVWIPAK